MERLIRIALGLLIALTLVFAFSSCKQSHDNTPSDNIQNDNIHNDDTPSDNTQDSIPPVDDSGDAEAPKDEECHHVDLTFAEENHKSPTCTEYGSYDKIAYCADCGEKISWETVLVLSPGHSYDLVCIENKVESTCQAQGSYEEVTYCSACNEVGSRNVVVLPLADHSYSAPVRENEVSSTCQVQGGYNEVTYCSVCNEVGSRNEVVLLLADHSYSDPVRENEVESTCQVQGSYDEVIYCSACNKTVSFKTVVLPRADHYCTSPTTENLTATCKEDGTVEYVEYCDMCNVEMNRTAQPVKASGHIWQNNACTVCHTRYSVAECLDLELSEDGTYYIITGIGTFTGTTLEIPSTYNNKIVKEIADYAFANCTFVTKAIIPISITKIGRGAAFGCTGLREIEFKNVRGWHLRENGNPDFDISIDDEIKKALADYNLSSALIDSPLFAGTINSIANKEINDKYINLLTENENYYIEK